MLGRRNPVEKIIKLVHEKGGVVLVDAAQAVLHETVDVTALDADFLAFSGHKMMAPMGIGVLYGKEKLLEEMPPFLTGGEMIETVTREGATYAELPHKFEAGTVNGAGAVGLAAAIDYRKEIGINTIQKREAELTKMLFDGMSRIPYVHILGSTRPEEHGGILSFVIDGVHPHDIASILDDSQIAVRAGHHCAQPLLKHLGVLASARASLAFYNDEKDIERFLDCLTGFRRYDVRPYHWKDKGGGIKAFGSFPENDPWRGNTRRDRAVRRSIFSSGHFTYACPCKMCGARLAYHGRDAGREKNV